MSSVTVCQIRLKGHLSGRRAGWFVGLTIVNEPNGEVTLTGPVRDQAELHGLLTRVRDLNLTLMAVEQLPGAAIQRPEPN
jgi:hypothetical protein